MRVGFGLEAERQRERLAEPLEHDLRRVALEQAEMLLQHLAERPVRDAPAVRQAAAGPPQRLGPLVAQPLPELTHEPRLADAGVAHERDRMRTPVAEDAPVRRLQQLELALTPDERALERADAARSHQGERAHEPPARDRLGLALDDERFPLLELECAARRLHRPLADQHLTGAGVLLQSRAHVDGVTRDERASLAS